mmetsp:Transcript_5596/g.16222  ORF Transcript_5596/g.16222 Transcript_5596/m.16222 type:complete len:229 (-) Transcript_5596:576-1262(-)
MYVAPAASTVDVVVSTLVVFVVVVPVRYGRGRHLREHDVAHRRRRRGAATVSEGLHHGGRRQDRHGQDAVLLFPLVVQVIEIGSRAFAILAVAAGIDAPLGNVVEPEGAVPPAPTRPERRGAAAAASVVFAAASLGGSVGRPPLLRSKRPKNLVHFRGGEARRGRREGGHVPQVLPMMGLLRGSRAGGNDEGVQLGPLPADLPGGGRRGRRRRAPRSLRRGRIRGRGG